MTDPTDPSYTAQALRTESPITPALQTRLRDTPRLVHAVLGLLTEAGELADPIKKHIFYGRPVDAINLREEIGDCLWYLAIAADALGTTLEAEQARNLAKLRARYPHVFTAEAAQVRDLDRERQVLESDTAPAPPCAECARKQHQVDAAQVTILAQRAGIERLRAFVAKARQTIRRTMNYCDVEFLLAELAELDASNTEPTPVAEPARCPECERLRAEILRATRDNAKVVYGLEGKIKSLQRFAEKIRMAHHCDNWPSITMAVDELDGEFTAPIESAPGTEPTPVAEPLDGEGGQ